MIQHFLCPTYERIIEKVYIYLSTQNNTHSQCQAYQSINQYFMSVHIKVILDQKKNSSKCTPMTMNNQFNDMIDNTGIIQNISYVVASI